MMKFSLVENHEWLLLLKETKPINQLFLQNHMVYLAEILYLAFVGPDSDFQNYQNEKNL